LSVLLYFFWAIVLSVLRYTDSDYPFGISKLFLDPSWRNKGGGNLDPGKHIASRNRDHGRTKLVEF